MRALGISIGASDNAFQVGQATRVGAAVIQVTYNRLDRAAEGAVFDLCEQHDLGVLAREPLANGYLSGKYQPGDRIASADDWRSSQDRDQVQRKPEAVAHIAEIELPAGVEMAPWALAWTLQHPRVTAVVAGCRTVEPVQRPRRRPRPRRRAPPPGRPPLTCATAPTQWPEAAGPSKPSTDPAPARVLCARSAGGRPPAVRIQRPRRFRSSVLPRPTNPAPARVPCAGRAPHPSDHPRRRAENPCHTRLLVTPGETAMTTVAAAAAPRRLARRNGAAVPDVRDFVAAWDKVMNVDRFDLT